MVNRITKLSQSVIKSTAVNIDKYNQKKEKIEEKIAALTEELNEINETIDTWQKPIMSMTGGFTTDQLIDKIVDTSGKTTITKFAFKYPDTIIPPATPEVTDLQKEEESDMTVNNSVLQHADVLGTEAINDSKIDTAPWNEGANV